MASTLNLSNATSSNFSGMTDLEVVVPPKQLDGVSAGKETYYQNTNWAKYWGYFNAVPELKSAVLMKAIWNVGKGYNCDYRTKAILEHIRGMGKDTFDDILFNMEVIKYVGGDSFAEIIKDEKTGILINLKPLDPSTIKIIVDEKGMLLRYEQTAKTKGFIQKFKSVLGFQTGQVFKPENILHLSNNRMADQIHGISDIESLETTILAEYENFDDMKKIMHRQAKPMIMFKLGTDNETKINAFISKMDQATRKGENIYIPDDDNAVSYEVIQVNVSSLIFDWRNDIRNKFYRAMGLPQIVFGSAGTTESGGKIEYLAHEQVFEKNQRYLEKQILNQLGVKIDLIPPTSMLDSISTDQAKDGTSQFQASDLIAGAGR